MKSAEEGVIIEYLPHGRFVKVSAIDPVTYTEASIVGDPSLPHDHLARLAVRKLRYVLEKKRKQP